MQFFSFLITKFAKHSFLRVNIRKDVHLSKQLFLGLQFFLFFSVKLPAFMIYHDLLRQSMNINIFNCLFASFLYEIIELFFFLFIHCCIFVSLSFSSVPLFTLMNGSRDFRLQYFLYCYDGNLGSLLMSI